MKHTILAASIATTFAGSAAADFVGWTANVRLVTGGFLINVFAATDNPGDVLLNRYGGLAGPSAGYIVTNAAGGFRQGTGAQATFAPAGNQGWTSLDSFLTVGGALVGGAEWAANPATAGDPTWSVSYFDTALGSTETVNAFSTPSNSTGFTNPYLSAIPPAAGWYIGGITAEARSLASLANRVASTGPAAAAATHGMLVAQLYVTDTAWNRTVSWRLGASMRRPDGSLSQGTFEFVIPVNPCVTDMDNDGLLDCDDQCPDVPGTAACNGCPPNVCGTCGPAPDADGDAVPDCIDNCPAVANPGQADCNGNGVGEACESFADCNGNGLPDSCDIASGTSSDIDANGVPDECKPDCNDNGLPDGWEIATGRVPDCDDDGIPDTCQGAVEVDATSPDLGAPSGSQERVHAFEGLPFATGPVTIRVEARGDLNQASEYGDVIVGNGTPRRVFGPEGNDCPATPDVAVVTVPAAEFNAAFGSDGRVAVRLACPPTVDGSECGKNGLTRFTLEYFGIGPGSDCDNDRIRDRCEIASGGAADCNGNGRPDNCDIASGEAVDCDADGIPDSCELAGNPSLDCNGNGILDSCDLAAGSPDIDGNGKPDDCQTVTVPGQFPTIQSAIASAPTTEMRIILVAPGTHPGPIDFLGKPVIVRGDSAATTVIQGTGGATASVVRFSGGEPAIAALERVTVRGGTTGSPLPGSPQFLVGGGIQSFQSAASVRDCVIEQNFASFGGGGYWLASTGRIERCTFRSNASGSDGGGIQLFGGSVTVTDTVIENNACNSRGGGMHAVDGRPTLLRTIIRDNQSSNVVGGLSWVPFGSSTAFMTIQESQVTGNTAAIVQGGIGIQSDGASVKISLAGTTVCNNVPRPNISGAWTNLGGNTVCVCAGDLNDDQAINGNDLGIFLAAWGPCVSSECPTDFNQDGVTDGLDLGFILSRWGSCPP